MQLFYILTFIIGLGFGSFASVIIHRLHTRERGIMFGRSKCPRCAKTLATRDLIPLVSFVINKFKCRFCKEPISFRYPILEIVMGSSFLLTSLLIGFKNPYLLAYYLLITFIFVLLSFYDIFFQEIPDQISIPTIILTGLVGYFGQLHATPSLLIGFAIPVLFFWHLVPDFQWQVAWRRRRKNWRHYGFCSRLAANPHWPISCLPTRLHFQRHRLAHRQTHPQKPNPLRPIPTYRNLHSYVLGEKYFRMVYGADVNLSG